METELPLKKIIHIDMDAFYASVEQLDDPDLKGKPIAVGGSSDRGVVAAASYEARKFGVHSALASSIAKRRCPQLIFVKPRFERYKELSQQIREIFFEYTDLVEPLSLDEAYLDVTDNKINHPSASIIAQEIRSRILKEVGLTASAGISINKFTAKIASDINKPNGQKTIGPDEILDFLETLPIDKFYGVGKVTAEKMKRLGIYTGKHLKDKTKEFLKDRFGKSGPHYFNIVRGIQRSEVKPHRERKSIAAERTFSDDVGSPVYMLERLEKIAVEVERRMSSTGIKGRTITVKIKYSDFTQQTRSRTLESLVSTRDEIFPVVEDLIYQEKFTGPVRLLGISLSNLSKGEEIQEDEDVSVQLRIDF